MKVTVLRSWCLAVLAWLPLSEASRGGEPRGTSADAVEVPSTVLAWDATEKTQSLNYGESGATFKFTMTNVSRELVVVERLNLSCGCTTLEAAPSPWQLAPGTAADFKVKMNLTGKIGTVTKSIFVTTDHGTKSLLITAEVKPLAVIDPAQALPSSASISPGAREQNIILSQTDRQAVFKADCAHCHARFAERKFGRELYEGACAICHDAEHRASMVPDLRVVRGPRDGAYWRQQITEGRPGTLMPAFARANQGILTDAQIESLVKFLVEDPPNFSPKKHKPKSTR